MSRRPLLTAKTVAPLTKTLYLSKDPGAYPSPVNYVTGYTNGAAGKWTVPVAASAIQYLGWKPVPNSPMQTSIYLGIWDASGNLIYYAVDGGSSGPPYPNASRLCPAQGGSQVAMDASQTYRFGIYNSDGAVQLAQTDTNGSTEINQSLVAGFDRRSFSGSTYSSGFNPPVTSSTGPAPVFFVVFK